jgi:Tol biopolymer transport system component
MSGHAAPLIILFAFLAACSGNAELLPSAVYYLRGREAEAQVWRQTADDVTAQQITNEQAGVQEYSVSTADGSLAIIVDNQLFLVGAEGADRLLIADGSAVDPNVEDYAFRGFVSDPVFSPDGAMLAYALDGLHLYDIATGEDDHVLTNLGNLLGESFVFSKEAYSPGPWSPDGSKLLIIMGYYEGSTLAVMDMRAEQPFTRLRSNGPVCCIFAWSADSNSVLVANPNYTGDIPGLWSYNVSTGEETVLIPGIAEDGSINFVGFPFQRPDGTLQYFLSNQDHFSPDVGIPLTLVSSNADGSGATLLRAETFSFSQILWAPNGSLALIVESDENRSRLLLVPTDDSPIQTLVEADLIRNLEWGP